MELNYLNILDLIKDVDPRALDNIKHRFPEQADLFQPDIHFGLETARSFDPNEIFVLGMASKTGLEIVLKKCQEILPGLKKQLARLGKIQLGSQIIIGVSGASLLTQASNQMVWVNTLIGLFTMAGSIMTIYAQHRSGSAFNSNQSIFNMYDKLVDNKVEAEQLLIELELALHAFNEGRLERISVIINDANKICLETKKMLEKT